jgi:transcriptional regulator with XRE-family HTH domain
LTVEEFGMRVQEMRDARSWSGTELAKRAGISPTTLYAIENGKHKPRGATIRRLARAFELTPQELVADAPKERRPSPVEAAEALLRLFERAEQVAVERGGQYMVEISGAMAKRAYRILRALWVRALHGEDVPAWLIDRWEALADRCWSRIPESVEPVTDEQVEELLRSVEMEPAKS